MVDKLPSRTDEPRPFLPTKDLAISKRFYQTLGFETILEADVVIFRAGAGSFILQAYFQQQRAENSMMQLLVDDLDAWCERILALDLPGTFGVQAPRAPKLQPWGLRVAYVFDPAGVLWHFAERRAD